MIKLTTLIIILGLIFTTPIYAKEKHLKIIYSKEYVSQYLGEVITVSFISDHEQYNRITMLMTEVVVKNKYYKETGYRKVVNYYLIGKSQVSNKIIINLNKIMSITK